MSTLKLAQPGFLNIYSEAAASVASMVAMPLNLPSKSPLMPIFIIDALVNCFWFFLLFRKDNECCDAIDQSMSPWVVYVYLEKTPIQWIKVCLLFRKDTRHCDAMDQSVSPWAVHTVQQEITTIMVLFGCKIVFRSSGIDLKSYKCVECTLEWKVLTANHMW